MITQIFAFTASTLGIVMMVLGRYLLLEGTWTLRE